MEKAWAEARELSSRAAEDARVREAALSEAREATCAAEELVEEARQEVPSSASSHGPAALLCCAALQCFAAFVALLRRSAAFVALLRCC